MDTELVSIFDGQPSDWMDTLPPYQRDLIAQMLTDRDPVEVSLAWLNSTGPANTEQFGAFRTASNAFYDSLLSQIHSLLCGTTRDHADERKELIRNAKMGRAALVTATSGIIASHLGVSAVLIAPAVALTYAVMTQAGKDSSCAALAQLIEERRSDAKQP